MQFADINVSNLKINIRSGVGFIVKNKELPNVICERFVLVKRGAFYLLEAVTKEDEHILIAGDVNHYDANRLMNFAGVVAGSGSVRVKA
jgi:hypothetical protein